MRLEPAVLIKDIRDGVPCAICGEPTTRGVDPAIIGGIGGIICSAHAQSIILDAVQTAHWYAALREYLRPGEDALYPFHLGLDWPPAIWSPWREEYLYGDRRLQQIFIERSASILSPAPREQWLAGIDKQSWLALGYGPAQSFGLQPARWRAENGTGSWHDLMPPALPSFVSLDRVRAERERNLDWLEACAREWVQQGQKSVQTSLLADGIRIETGRAGKSQGIPYISRALGAPGEWTYVPLDNLRWREQRQREAWLRDAEALVSVHGLLDGLTYASLNWDREVAARFARHPSLLRSRLSLPELLARTLAYREPETQPVHSWHRYADGVDQGKAPDVELVSWVELERIVSWAKEHWPHDVDASVKHGPDIHVHFQERLHQGGYLRKAFDEDGLIYTSTKNWTTKPKHKPLDELHLIGVRENKPRWQHIRSGDYEHSRQLQQWTRLKARSDATLIDRHHFYIHEDIRPASTSITCAQCGTSVKRILWPGLELRPHWECPDCKPDVGDEVHGSPAGTPASVADMDAQLETSIEDSAEYQVENDSDYDRDYGDVDYNSPEEVTVEQRGELRHAAGEVGVDEHGEVGAGEVGAGEVALCRSDNIAQGEDVASEVIGRKPCPECKGTGKELLISEGVEFEVPCWRCCDNDDDGTGTVEVLSSPGDEAHNPSLRTLESDPEVRRLQAELNRKLAACVYYDRLHDKGIDRCVDGHPICFSNKSFLADQNRPEVLHHLRGVPWAKIGRRDVKPNTKAKNEERRISHQSEFDTAHAQCLAEHIGDYAIFALVDLDKLRAYRLNVSPLEPPGPERWKKIEEEIAGWYRRVLKDNLRKRGSKSERAVRERIRKAFKAVAVRSLLDNVLTTPLRDAPEPEEYEAYIDD
jgi:hypothetical protein